MPDDLLFHLRDCREDDIPAIAEIYADAVLNGTASFELTPPDVAEMRARRAALLKGGHPYIVAERAGAVLGYAYAGPYRARPAYAATVEDSIYIAPSAKGQGLGKALLSRLIAEAEARGFRRMVAAIGDSENHASIALHARLGFEMVGVLRSVGWKHGRWLDSVLMQRSLGEGDATPCRA